MKRRSVPLWLLACALTGYAVGAQQSADRPGRDSRPAARRAHLPATARNLGRGLPLMHACLASVLVLFALALFAIGAHDIFGRR